MSCAGHPCVAAVLDLVMAPLAEQRAKLVPLARGRTLEIGGDTGLNLSHYAADVDLVVVEPDPFMARRLKRRAERLGRAVALHEHGAERLAFDDHSFDTVVATWVFCTIPDPEAAIHEVRRVLRPGGTLLFAEHTVSPSPGWARLQRTVDPLWTRVAGGCHLDRDSLGLFRAAGFELDVAPNRHATTSLVPSFRGTGRVIR